MIFYNILYSISQAKSLNVLYLKQGLNLPLQIASLYYLSRFQTQYTCCGMRHTGRAIVGKSPLFISGLFLLMAPAEGLEARPRRAISEEKCYARQRPSWRRSPPQAGEVAESSRGSH